MATKKKTAKKKVVKKKAAKKKVVKKKTTIVRKKPGEVPMIARKDGTIGGLIIRMVKGSATNEEILETVIKRFPNCTTSTATIAWYRNRMRQSSQKIPTNRSLVQKAALAEGKKVKKKAS